MPTKIISSYGEVSRYLDEVRAAADSDRNALGFLPASAYAEFAFQNRLLLALDEASNEYAGHLVYGGACPQARVFQTYVGPSFRGKGIGRRLVAKLVERAEQAAFLSLKAEVAADLPIANEFYASLGFELIRSRRGGSSRGRTIYTRVKELSTPSLLHFAAASDQKQALSFYAPPTQTPLYLIDLNVLYDVIRRRPNAEAARLIFSAGWENSVQLAVSTEFIRELERTSTGARDDVLEIAKALPRLSAPSAELVGVYFAQLAALIFPDRWRQEALTVQDKSDLAHLITAIAECATGFITSEKAILAAADEIRRLHSLEVLSPSVFGMAYETPAKTLEPRHVSRGASGVCVRQMTETEHASIQERLISWGATAETSRLALKSGLNSSPRRKTIVTLESAPIAFASWDSPQHSRCQTEVNIFGDEESPAFELAASHLLHSASVDLSAHGPSIIDIDPPPGQPTVRAVAQRLGYRPVETHSGRPGRLRKGSLGRLILPEGWAAARAEMAKTMGVRLPEEAPNFEGPDQIIPVGTRASRGAQISLRELESVLSPILFALPGRPAVVLPIWPGYAEELFRGSVQPSFLSGKEAVLLPEKIYVGSASSRHEITDGGLGIFYESGRSKIGRSAAIAVCRISRRYLMEKSAASAIVDRRGVLARSAVKKIGTSAQVTVTEFDNVMIFRSPVPLRDLRALGCVDATNFVSARAIASEYALEILRRGNPRVA